MKTTPIKTPHLKIDDILGHPSVNGKLERRVIANLINHVIRNGFKIVGIDDGEEFTGTTGIQDSMELIFNVDQCDIVVCTQDNKIHHSISIVLGNEPEDNPSDWTFKKNDIDGFDKMMEEFIAEDFI